MRTARSILAILPFFLVPAELEAGIGVSPRLAAALRGIDPGEEVLVWVTFTDKGVSGRGKLLVPEELVSRRALERRAAVLPANQLVDESDLPLVQTYMDGVERAGGRIRNGSRWLNAVSLFATPEAIGRIAALPQVAQIDLVGRFRRDPVRETRESSPGFPGGTPSSGDGGASRSAIDYGPSLPQVALVNVPAVHLLGHTGAGVIVGAFDNGFRLPGHTALAGLSILATRDFVDKKTSVVPLNPDPSVGAHGTHTLSTMAGYAPGNLVGPAFGATYILARTENDSSETPFEEDNWVTAIEWAESLGVQVTNTSLGYLTYDAPYTSWSWQNMDGRTTAITRAAAMAAKKGVIVVNSAGNNGSSPTPGRNTLNAPADADSILAVGAVTPSGLRASFSSVGPTTSVPPRIKPDVMATGTSIYHASASDPNGYLSGQGTSYASPIAAGVAAMLLSAVPNATAMQVINALKNTASRASTPDNQYGWGIIDAIAALRALDPRISEHLPTGIALRQNYPNPFNERTRIEFFVPEDADVSLRVYDLFGREVVTLVDRRERMSWRSAIWNGRDAGGSPCASGVYFCRYVVRGSSGVSGSVVQKLTLLR